MESNQLIAFSTQSERRSNLSNKNRAASWSQVKGFLLDQMTPKQGVPLADPYWFWNELGLRQVEAGCLEKAETCFETAVGICPGYTSARHHLAALSMIQGDFSTALFQFEQVLSSDPNHFYALINTALCCLELGDDQAARPLLAHGAGLVCKDGQAMAWCHAQLWHLAPASHEFFLERIRFLAARHPAAFRAYRRTLLDQYPDFADAVSHGLDSVIQLRRII